MLTAEDFRRRRQALAARMGAGTAAILRAAAFRGRSGDTDFPYRQDSDFFYLTGCEESDAWCILRAEGDEPCTLYVQARDRERETWVGRRLGVAGALAELGVDAARESGAFECDALELAANVDRLYLDPTLVGEGWGERLLRAGRAARHRHGRGVGELHDIGRLLHEQRLVKEPRELERMRRAAAISVEAHRRAMAACRPGVGEGRLQAELEYVFRRDGGSGAAYESVVASGANATILHYVENTRRMQAGDLVLVDAGAEYRYYAADITRTYPVDGRFSAVQRAVYEVVLEARRAALECCRVGCRMADVHSAAQRMLVAGMVELGLLQGSVDGLIESGECKRFYMHGTSHWLGMDVHDVGDYKLDGESRELRPGMVLTVEPGLYIRTDEADVADELLGIGVRIEDDVVIDAAGAEILSAALPVAIDEVEVLIGVVADA
jgi:Xaa-Pro aminopeptidase